MDDLYSSIRFLETLLEEVKTGKFPDSDIDLTKLARMTAAAYYKVIGTLAIAIDRL